MAAKRTSSRASLTSEQLKAATKRDFNLPPVERTARTESPPPTPQPSPLLESKTSTLLARGAIDQLDRASVVDLKGAITTLIRLKVAANKLMTYPEQKVIIREVLDKSAKEWSIETRRNFAGVFSVANNNKYNLMNSIVSIAILNDPYLDGNIWTENTPETTEEALLEDRLITWQYPEPGAPLDTPSLVLVAVEQQDVAKAKDIAQSIIGGLVDYNGYKIPANARKRLK